MKLIIPMAGRGSRLRPHTLTVPKPLIPVAGKPIVHRLVSDIAKVLGEPVDEIAFILGDPAFFGDDVVTSLKELAESLGQKGYEKVISQYTNKALARKIELLGININKYCI